MANVNLGGFRPWGTLSGGQGVFPNTMIGEVANNYNTAIGRYDILSIVSDGTLARAATADNGKLIGVANAFSYVINGKREFRPFIPASTTFTPTTVGSKNASLVQYYPLTGDLVLEVDADDGVTATTIALQIGLVGENADMTVGDCNSVTGVSTYCLDISDRKTATANFRMIMFRGGYTLANGITLGDNDPTASRFKFLVVCNEGVLPPYTATGV